MSKIRSGKIIPQTIDVWEQLTKVEAQRDAAVAALKWLMNTFCLAVPPQDMRESYRPAYRNARKVIAAAEGNLR